MNKRKILLTIAILILLSGLITYNYMYKNHRDISQENAMFKIESKEFIREFSIDVNTAVDKYLDKTIELKGEITEIEKDNFILNNTIVCYADSIVMTQVAVSKVFTVKGRSIGYDELLEQIKLDQVTIINP